MQSVEAILTSAQPRWAGHLVRMDEDRIPRAVFYGELKTGPSRISRPTLRYKDVVNRHLNNTCVPLDNWEDLARNRGTWKQTVRSGCRDLDERRAAEAADRRQRAEIKRTLANGH